MRRMNMNDLKQETKDKEEERNIEQSDDHPLAEQKSNKNDDGDDENNNNGMKNNEKEILKRGMKCDEKIENPAGEGEEEDITKRISPATCFAFVDLLITVLKLDFYREGEGDYNARSKEFCESVLDIVLEWSNLPVKTKEMLKLHMKGDNLPNEDLAELITAIKSDPILRKTPDRNGDRSILLLQGLLVAILKRGAYDSRHRVMLRHVAALLSIPWEQFEAFEDLIAEQIVAFKDIDDTSDERKKQQRTKKLKRFAMIGAATGLGGVLVGLTGGLAAPFVASGIATLTASATFAGLATTSGALIFGTLFGAAGAGLSGYRMSKRVGATEEFVVEGLEVSDQTPSGLRCVLCVSGFIKDNDEGAFRRPWRHLWLCKEQYTLRWEGKYLEELGKAIEYFISFAVSVAIQRSLMETVLAGLVSAIAWPLALLGSSSVIDNPWNVCTSRAREVGEHLAHLLLTRQHGSRPITLIGYSLGARVIYHCLLEMNRRGASDGSALGIVEDVILFGAPVTGSRSQWTQICNVVGGRVINGYCRSDWLLRFLYRTMNAQINIAGTGPIDNRGERKIVNYDLSHIVKGHMDYVKKLTLALDAVGVRTTPLSQASHHDLHALELEQQSIAGAEMLDKSNNFSPTSLPSSMSTPAGICSLAAVTKNSPEKDLNNLRLDTENLNVEKSLGMEEEKLKSIESPSELLRHQRHPLEDEEEEQSEKSLLESAAPSRSL